MSKNATRGLDSMANMSSNLAVTLFLLFVVIFLQVFLLNLFGDALNVIVRQLNSFVLIPTRADLGTRWDVYRNQFERLLSIAEILLFLMSAAIFGQNPAGPAAS